MAQKYYDTAVFGTTFLGMGAALQMENVVVIEKGGLFGAEFVNSYKVCIPKVVVPKTKQGRTFLEDLKRRGLVSEAGEIYPAPAVYVLSSYLKEKSIDTLLMTEVTGIKKVEGYYEIMVYHSSGFETIYAKRILDSTTLGICHKEAEKYQKQKQLNAIVYNPDKSQLEGLSFNGLNGLYTYTLPVDLEIDRYEAVEMLCGMENIFKERNLQISSIGSDFSYVMEPCREEVAEQFIWMPSTAFANLVEAFDNGVQYGIGNMEER